MSSGGPGPADDITEWFELDDYEGDNSSEADRQFLGILRERAAGWAFEPEDTSAYHVWVIDRYELRVILDLSDHDARLHLLTYGVVFDGSRITGDRLHGQTHDFELPTADRIEDTGPVPYLAAKAARWFESILARPVEHREWYSFEQVVNEEWVIASTGEVLSRTAPRRPGRDNRPGVPPDRVTLVSGKRG